VLIAGIFIHVRTDITFEARFLISAYLTVVDALLTLMCALILEEADWTVEITN